MTHSETFLARSTAEYSIQPRTSPPKNCKNLLKNATFANAGNPRSVSKTLAYTFSGKSGGDRGWAEFCPSEDLGNGNGEVVLKVTYLNDPTTDEFKRAQSACCTVL